MQPARPLRCAPRAARLAAGRRHHGAAIDALQRVIYEAVPMHGTILMKLRHDNILEAITSDAIIQPHTEALCESRYVIAALNAGRVERESHEPLKLRIRPCVVLHALARASLRSLISRTARRPRPVLRSGRGFPTRLAKYRPVRYQNAHASIRISLHSAVVHDIRIFSPESQDPHLAMYGILYTLFRPW